jgi:hypothetical protein
MGSVNFRKMKARKINSLCDLKETPAIGSYNPRFDTIHVSRKSCNFKNFNLDVNYTTKVEKNFSLRKVLMELMQ